MSWIGYIYPGHHCRTCQYNWLTHAPVDVPTMIQMKRSREQHKERNLSSKLKPFKCIVLAQPCCHTICSSINDPLNSHPGSGKYHYLTKERRVRCQKYLLLLPTQVTFPFYILLQRHGVVHICILFESFLRYLPYMHHKHAVSVTSRDDPRTSANLWSTSQKDHKA